MSLYEAKLPSLRDKLSGKAVEKVVEVKEVEKKEIKKGRRLNK